MEILINKKEFQNILKIAKPLFKKKQTITPILDCVLLEVSPDNNNVINIYASDLEVSLKCKVNARIIDKQDNEKEQVAVDFKNLQKAISKIKTKEISIKKEGEIIYIQGIERDKTKGEKFTKTFTFGGLSKNSDNDIKRNSVGNVFKLFRFDNTNDFPVFPSYNDIVYNNISLLNLQKALGKVMCIKENDNYPGVYWEYINNSKKLRFVTTDGFRLAYSEIDFNNVSGFENVYLPYSVCRLLLMLSDKNIEFGIKDKLVVFKTKNVVICSNVIKKSFPLYHNLVPKENDFEVVLPNDMFKEALEEVLTFCEKVKSVQVEFEKDKIQITNSKNTESEVKREVAVLESKNLENKQILCFNGKFILDVLKVVDKKLVIFSLNIDNRRPCVLKEKDNDNFVYLIAPIIENYRN